VFFGQAGGGNAGRRRGSGSGGGLLPSQEVEITADTAARRDRQGLEEYMRSSRRREALDLDHGDDGTYSSAANADAPAWPDAAEPAAELADGSGIEQPVFVHQQNRTISRPAVQRMQSGNITTLRQQRMSSSFGGQQQPGLSGGRFGNLGRSKPQDAPASSGSGRLGFRKASRQADIQRTAPRTRW